MAVVGGHKAHSDFGSQSIAGDLYMTRLLALAAIGAFALSNTASAQQVTWLWWGATDPIPVSAAHPLPVTGIGGGGVSGSGTAGKVPLWTGATTLGDSTISDAGVTAGNITIDASDNTNILNGGLVVGAPTGGGQGAGTVNAATAYWLNGGASITEPSAGAIQIAVAPNLGLVNSVLINGSDAATGTQKDGGRVVVTGGAADPTNNTNRVGGSLFLTGGPGSGAVEITSADAYVGSSQVAGEIRISTGLNDTDSGHGPLIIDNLPSIGATTGKKFLCIDTTGGNVIYIGTGVSCN